MKNSFTLILVTIILSLSIIACGGFKPDVKEVSVTAPWSSMNLPISDKENAVVWASSPTELKVVQNADKKTTVRLYTDAMKAQGWSVGKFDETADIYNVDMTKGGETLAMEVYDFQPTGVIIKKKS